MKNNIDKPTVTGFGDEWGRFDQSKLSIEEHQKLFDLYFSIFPWDMLKPDATGFDLGCGSGRWAKLVAPRVGTLHCIDPSSAIEIAKKNLSDNSNCQFYHSDVDHMPLDDQSMDFGYSIGVLHHIPDTQKAMNLCVKKLKAGAPFLVYLYYSFDNKPGWFKLIWKISEFLRFFVSKLPHNLRYYISQIIAIIIYLPLAKCAYFFEKLGFEVSDFPLSAYRKHSFYTMRTDSLDRFGTRLEQRFSKNNIRRMMENSGLENIEFSLTVPFWCAVGTRKIFSDEQLHYGITDKYAAVSVIIPCFNCTKTIFRAMNSIATQTVKPLEVILVDDASDDNTLTQLKLLEKSYPNWIKVISLSVNLGVASARNAGWEIATQPYIAFLDSDDAWHPRKIEIQYKYMKENLGVILSGHNYIQIDEIDLFKNKSHISIDEDLVFYNVSRKQILFSNCFSTPSVMLRSNIVQRFPEGKRYGEDYHLWLELCCTGMSCSRINIPLTFLFKDSYGEEGLSAQLWNMEKGELTSYQALFHKKIIRFTTLILLLSWSLIRFIRRTIISSLRNILWS